YGEKNENAIGYFNSKNDQYYLALIERPHSYMGYLYDFTNRQIHQFNLIEVTEGETVDFKLQYVKTDRLRTNNQKEYQKYVFDFTTISATDSLKTVRLQAYKNAKHKVPVMTYELKIKPNQTNLFHIFRETALHPFESLNTLNYPGGVVTSAIGHTLTGTRTSFRLEKLQKVTFEIQVP